MGAEHMKALLVIFALLFFCLMAGSVFIAIQIQHLGIAVLAGFGKARRPD